MALRELSAEQHGDLVELESVGETPGEPVGIDDVIEMHEFLGDFNGDFQSLFSRSRR
jgi:hypothetical protein